MSGKQPDRHTEWLRNRCGLSATAETADGDRADIQADAPAAVKGVTLCHREAGNIFGGDQLSYIFAYFAQQFGCRGDGDEIAPTEM